LSQQFLVFLLGLLVFALAFVPNEIKLDSVKTMRTEWIKFLVVIIAFGFWINVYWR
jgi:hypothetical protein